jgi:predicted RNA-binding Zn-ribbon protein involved in translation (DUF1610 family)
MSTTPPPTVDTATTEIDTEANISETPIALQVDAKLTPSQGKKFPCSACGASLVFDPTAQTLKCTYCGHQEKIPQSAEEIVENSYEAYLQQSRAGLKVTAGAELETKCQACGAVIMMNAKTVTQECPFCGVHLESQPKTAEPIIEPAAVLPFKVDQNGARKVFKQWVNSRWFAPNTFKQIGDLGRLIGLYAPYWTFDAMTFTFYAGQRGTYYYVTESFTAMVNGKPTPRTRQVRKIRWTPAEGQVRHWFDDVLVVASRGLPTKYAQELAPWDLNQLSDFKPDYLSGFRTERYQVGLEEGFAEAKRQMEPVIDSLIRQNIGGDEQKISSRSTQYSGITFKHILLPVWVSAYRYADKLHRILINARTGEVQGSRPYSPWKIAGLVILVLAIVGLIALLQSGSSQ